MYTKSAHRDTQPIIIPENYNGNAFSERIDSADFSSSLSESPVEIEISNDTKEPDLPPSKSLLSSLLPPKVAAASNVSGNALGLEELLIIGVIILLTQSNSDNDILLLLFLLLFYK